MSNKQKIIEEILSLEPELKSKEKELTSLIEKIIETKPNIKISESFRINLKNQLLNKGQVNVFNKKKINFVQIFMSFLVWWVTAFSIAWIVWINFDSFENIDKPEMQLWMISSSMLKWSPQMLRNSDLPPEISRFVSYTDESNTEIESFSEIDNHLVEDNAYLWSPATEFCLENKWKIETEEYQNICVLENWYKCEEWSYFNWKCRLKIEFTKLIEDNNLDKKYLKIILDIVEKYRY